MINYLRNNYEKILITSIGLNWIIIIILIRFFIIRIPYKISTNVPSIYLMISIGLLCTHLGILIITILHLYNPKETKNKLILNFRHLSNICYWNPLIAFHDNIIKNIPYSGYIWEDLFNTSIRLCRNKARVYFSVICLDFMPRIIVATAFFIDVVIYKQFAYLYILLVIIIIPLTFQGFIYIGHDFGKRNQDIIENYINVYHDTLWDCHQFELKPEYDDNNPETLSHYEDLWLMFSNIKCFCIFLKEFKLKYQPYIILYTSSCYCISWISYLRFVLEISNFQDFINYFAMPSYVYLYLGIIVYFSLLYMILWFNKKTSSINLQKFSFKHRKRKRKIYRRKWN